MKKPAVLYEDDTCLALDKPCGLATQGGAGVGHCVDDWLRAEYGADPARRPLLVHRLDKDTSGVLLTARGPENAAFYAGLIAGRAAVKRYVAVCLDGGTLEERGLIRGGLFSRGKTRDARTRYRVAGRGRLGSGGDTDAPAFAVVELEPETGRTHQIRRHLRQSGCPVLGDDKYGDFALNRLLRKTLKLDRLLLHAARLVIPRPAGGPLDIRAPLPAAFFPFTGGLAG